MFLSTHRNIISLPNLYTSETWCFTIKKGRLASDRELLSKIWEPAKYSEVWKTQYNRELYELFKEADIMVVIVMVWVGKTVTRMIV
jgi:hypothetical protein